MKSIILPCAITLAFALTLNACGSKSAASAEATETSANDSGKKPGKKGPKNKILPITVDPNANTSETDNFSLYSAEIEDGYLKTIVNYSGGCKEHNFSMVTNGMWLKSNPPQLNLTLLHNANEDFCKAFIFDTLRFDMTNCVNPSVNKVVLRVNVPGGKTEHVEFEYELQKSK